MTSDRLQQQIRFVLEIDRLKRIERRTLLTDRSRRENSAEHSWHIALMAVLLAEHADGDGDGGGGLDLFRVVRMLLVHDLVEIDAGDTFCYDEAANHDKEEREHRAAERIFGLLPEDQEREMWELWREFEARETAEARYANALDRLQPMLHNYHTGGGTWREHGVTRRQVVARNQVMEEGAAALWEHARRFLDDAVARGLLEE